MSDWLSSSTKVVTLSGMALQELQQLQKTQLAVGEVGLGHDVGCGQRLIVTVLRDPSLFFAPRELYQREKTKLVLIFFEESV